MRMRCLGCGQEWDDDSDDPLVLCVCEDDRDWVVTE
jgi:hypothetical protein